MRIKQYLAILLPVALIACSTTQLIETSDPNLKLDQSQQLIKADKPLQAEILLQQALIIYKENNNKMGEAEAYQRIGIYYSSEHYHDNADHYKQQQTYDAGNVKALSYLKKADFLFQKTGNFYGASITNYLIAVIYQTWGNKKAACGYLARAINLNKDKIFEKSKHYMNLPNEYKSYEEFIEAGAMPDVDCN